MPIGNLMPFHCLTKKGLPGTSLSIYLDSIQMDHWTVQSADVLRSA